MLYPSLEKWRKGARIGHMERKIFISINIPARDKKRLAKTVEKWQDLPIKLVKEPNFHVTLLYLGHLPDDSIVGLCDEVRAAAEETEIFDLEFTEIVLAPSKEDPKMIWLSGSVSPELKSLSEDIEKRLEIFVKEKKAFRPHITLGRLRKHKWDAQVSQPEISEKFPLLVTADSVSIMASDFANDGQEYTLIEDCPLS
jgi:2'-5' RNA ligase